jgi:hypothetical protein
VGAYWGVAAVTDAHIPHEARSALATLAGSVVDRNR